MPSRWTTGGTSDVSHLIARSSGENLTQGREKRTSIIPPHSDKAVYQAYAKGAAPNAK